jgi:hypothetical protein
MSAPIFTELEVAASSVIRILKIVPEFSNAKVSVIGELGLWKYLRSYPTTEVSLTLENSTGADTKFGVRMSTFLLPFKGLHKQWKINCLQCPLAPSCSKLNIVVQGAERQADSIR